MNKLILLFLISISLVSCAELNNEGVGTVTGGVVGGLLGNTIGGGSGKVAATAGGIVIGSFLGNNIGRYMDRVDKLALQKALETVPSGGVSNWQNPDNGNCFMVKPTKTYYKENHQPCREYTTTAIIGGKTEQIYGKACRDAAGNWKIQ